MKRRNPPITLSTLPARTLYHAVLPFTQHHPRPHPKARKPLYPKALILTLALRRTARRASDRHLLFCLAPEALPDQPVPALGTLLYRLKIISDERWHALLSWLAAQGIAKEPPDAPFPTPADEGRLLAAWLVRYGSGVVGSGALLVGDKLYGHRGRLLRVWSKWGGACGTGGSEGASGGSGCGACASVGAFTSTP